MLDGDDWAALEQVFEEMAHGFAPMRFGEDMHVIAETDH